MQPWQLTFLGRRELPIELTSFELRYFFSFNDAERQAIRTRRRALNQLGAALHLGFMKMSGCALDAFEMVPRTLLTHLGTSLAGTSPQSLQCARYRRGVPHCLSINDGRPRHWDFARRPNISDVP